MPKYWIDYTIKGYGGIEIEADSEKEARELMNASNYENVKSPTIKQIFDGYEIEDVIIDYVEEIVEF